MSALKARFLGSWLGERLLVEGEVTAVEECGKAYRRISIKAPALADNVPALGDKVQVLFPDVGTRTYTPFAMRRDPASFELLAYLHGAGPGSAWAHRVQAGERIRFKGPDRSLSLSTMTAPLALFGDETCLAVARCALDAHGERAAVVLAADDVENAREACRRIQVPEDAVVKRSDGDAFYVDVAKRLAAAATPNGTIVFAGSAEAIPLVRAQVRALGIKSVQKAKAYWAVGRTGLD